jgi:hypothetical protein
MSRSTASNKIVSLCPSLDLSAEFMPSISFQLKGLGEPLALNDGGRVSTRLRTRLRAPLPSPSSFLIAFCKRFSIFRCVHGP